MTRCWLIAAGLVLAADAARAADPPVATYTATYTVEYKGKQAGVSEWSVRDVGDGRYEFQARITPKGMLKLVRPKPTIERSQFASKAPTFVRSNTGSKTAAAPARTIGTSCSTGSATSRPSAPPRRGAS